MGNPEFIENRPKFKLLHRKGSTFLDSIASGVMLSAPLSDGYTQLAFFKDSLEIKAETMTKIAGKAGKYSASYDTKDGDLVHCRHDLAYISLNEANMRGLLRLLKERFEPNG